MLYLYFRHNTYCEANIYSYFCIFEYAVILGNMTYNMIAPPLVEYPIMAVKTCTKRRNNEYSPSRNEEEAKLIENTV